MRVLVCNRGDPASVNIRERLLETSDFEESSRKFRGRPIWSRSEALLVEVDGPTVTDDRLEPDLKGLNLPLRDVWFLSRHRAESGQPSLTVHPIGNHGPDAHLGGRPHTLSPAATRDMGALLRRLKRHRDRLGLPHQVTYEATHHGPTMSLPSLFVEIGSNDEWYAQPDAGRCVAAAIEDVLAGGGATTADGSTMERAERDHARRHATPILVSVGGGHYVPRATDLALAGAADFGHFLPTHAVEAGDADTLRRAIAATPGCTGVHVHRKGLKGPQRQRVLTWCAELGVPVWDRDGAAPQDAAGPEPDTPGRA